MQKRDAVIFVRVKPDNKKFLINLMKKDGFSTLASWFDGFIEDLEKKSRKRKK